MMNYAKENINSEDRDCPAVQCHACAIVYYFGVGENEMREEDKGQFYSELNKPHLVIKGEMVGCL